MLLQLHTLTRHVQHLSCIRGPYTPMSVMTTLAPSLAISSPISPGPDPSSCLQRRAGEGCKQQPLWGAEERCGDKAASAKCTIEKSSAHGREVKSCKLTCRLFLRAAMSLRCPVEESLVPPWQALSTTGFLSHMQLPLKGLRRVAFSYPPFVSCTPHPPRLVHRCSDAGAVPGTRPAAAALPATGGSLAGD